MTTDPKVGLAMQVLVQVAFRGETDSDTPSMEVLREECAKILLDELRAQSKAPSLIQSVTEEQIASFGREIKA